MYVCIFGSILGDDNSMNRDEADGECIEAPSPSCGDYVMHFLTLFWKLLFAFIPPTGSPIQMNNITWARFKSHQFAFGWPFLPNVSCLFWLETFSVSLFFISLFLSLSLSHSLYTFSFRLFPILQIFMVVMFALLCQLLQLEWWPLSLVMLRHILAVLWASKIVSLR